MAVDKHDGGLMMLLIGSALLWTGIRGDPPSLYTKVGEDVRLPCNNVVNSDCSSTTWIYIYLKSLRRLVMGRLKMTPREQRAERLSLGSDCSLTVHDVRAEDAGLYICQQYLTQGEEQHGEDAEVYLSVLTMTDLEPDTPLKLSCSLSSYDGPAGCNAGLAVNWVWADKPELKLNEDPKDPWYDIISESYCDITLTMTPRKEDNNRKLRCQLTSETGGKVELITFLDFPISFPDSTSTEGLNCPGSSSTEEVLFITRIVLFVVLTIAVVIVTVLHAKRTCPKAEVSSDMELRVIEG